MRHFRHLTYAQRKQIENMLKNKYPVAEIAKCFTFALSTIYLEIQRGTYYHLNSNGSKTKTYSADLAENKYRDNLKKKGIKPKLKKDVELARYIALRIDKKKYSPEAVMYEIRNNKICFTETIRSVNTIYSAIAKGYINGVRYKDLPRKGRYKRRNLPQVLKVHKRKLKGKSIEERKADVLSREEFGHWEMDCVIGKQNNNKTILVLTERKTRYEIIEQLKSHTMDEVRKAVNRIEKRYQSAFFTIFKTITVDNGSEFQDWKSIEKSIYRVGNRTEVYYCHPNSPHERGSNENCNELIRRWLPKGYDFDKKLTRTIAKKVEHWVNEYPRKMFSGKCANELFIRELTKMGVLHYYKC